MRGSSLAYGVRLHLTSTHVEDALTFANKTVHKGSMRYESQQQSFAVKHAVHSRDVTCRRRLAVLVLLLGCSILLYGEYAASWQWPWHSRKRAERQSVHVSTAAAPAGLRVPSASQ